MKSSRYSWVSNYGSDSAGGNRDAARWLDFGQFVLIVARFHSPWFRLDFPGRDEDGFDCGMVVDSWVSGELIGFCESEW